MRVIQFKSWKGLKRFATTGGNSDVYLVPCAEVVGFQLGMFERSKISYKLSDSL